LNLVQPKKIVIPSVIETCNFDPSDHLNVACRVQY